MDFDAVKKVGQSNEPIKTKFWSNFALIFPQNHVRFRSEFEHLIADFIIRSTGHN